MSSDYPRFEPVPLDLPADPLPLTRWDDGSIRVSGSAVKLETVVDAFRRGRSPHWIAESFPTLALADVYSVIAFSLRHEAAVDCYLAEIHRQAAAKARWARGKKTTADKRGPIASSLTRRDEVATPAR